MYLIWLYIINYWYNSCVIGFIVCVNIHEIKQEKSMQESLAQN